MLVHEVGWEGGCTEQAQAFGKGSLGHQNMGVSGGKRRGLCRGTFVCTVTRTSVLQQVRAFGHSSLRV